MPINKKVKSENGDNSENDSESETSSNESSDTESDIKTEHVRISFIGYNPQLSDIASINVLLRQLFVNEYINLKELSTVITKQNSIGTVVKEEISDDEEEIEETGFEVVDMSDLDDVVFGITTVINITQEKNSKCIQQLIDFIIKKSKEHADSNSVHRINTLLNDPDQKIGFIINERYINLPQSLAEPSFLKLMKEIKNASKTNSSFKFTYYILICKYSKIVGFSKKKKNHTRSEEDSEITWTNTEEELFGKIADIQFDYPVPNVSGTGLCGNWSVHDDQSAHYRKLVFIPAGKFKNLVKENFTDLDDE